jgi:hypothetical protein
MPVVTLGCLKLGVPGNRVRLGLAGRGDSSLNRDLWIIQSYGDDVATVAEKLDLKRVILNGHPIEAM